MRKILLFVSVVAFTSANAQFDINEHLKKKQKERFKEAKKIKENLRKIFPPICDGSGWVKPIPSTHPGKIKFTLPNGDLVVTNPAYNMPVVVTDIKRFRIMQNAGEDYFAKNFYDPGQQKFNDIPNGASELPLPDILQELLKNKKITIH